MKIIYSWRHMDSSKAAEEYCNEKMSRIGKYLHNVENIEISFELAHGEIHAHFKTHADGRDFNADNSNKDIYPCIDGLESKIMKQARRFNDKKYSN